MESAIIFANGRMNEPMDLAARIYSSGLIIAANGGSHHCRSLGIKPNVIIGDFDSLDANEITDYQQAGVMMIKYPGRKDETDLELALQYVLKQGFTQVLIIGGLGARWDMTVANLLLAAHPMFNKLKIHWLDGTQELTLLHGGEQVSFKGRSGHRLSLIPIAGDVHGITTDGLEYPLKNETLYFGSPRGVSNIFIQDTAQVHVRAGELLCVVDREINQEFPDH